MEAQHVCKEPLARRARAHGHRLALELFDFRDALVGDDAVAAGGCVQPEHLHRPDALRCRPRERVYRRCDRVQAPGLEGVEALDRILDHRVRDVEPVLLEVALLGCDDERHVAVPGRERDLDGHLPLRAVAALRRRLHAADPRDDGERRDDDSRRYNHSFPHLLPPPRRDSKALLSLVRRSQVLNRLPTSSPWATSSARRSPSTSASICARSMMNGGEMWRAQPRSERVSSPCSRASLTTRSTSPGSRFSARASISTAATRPIARVSPTSGWSPSECTFSASSGSSSATRSTRRSRSRMSRLASAAAQAAACPGYVEPWGKHVPAP